jgi:succinate-semialdehyde dehydrogenase/glutarate-semialdehyde dehydrogenase
MAKLRSVNPATGESIEELEEHSDGQVEERLALAERSFRAWRKTPISARGELLRRVGELLLGEKERFARVMTQEMGKTFASALAEAEKCAWACRYYAENGERFLADEPVASSATRSWVRHLPLGPVLAVMPWNFPFWQVFRFAAPALMAGNVGLLKHASNVPRCALTIEAIFREAGFPEGVFQTLLVGSSRVGPVVADGRVKAVTLTGSDAAGAEVGALAGRALKKVVLELGGSDPFVVMPSADLDAAARTAAAARTVNSGQSCIAAKRFLVHRDVYPRFERLFVEAMEALRVGDPMDPRTDLGPLATRQVLEGVEFQVQQLLAAGARLLAGGRRPEGRGWFYPPTVLVQVPRAAPVSREELFGPVAQLFEVRDLEEAIALANDTPFGLGSSVWTRDPEEQERFADELEAGQTFVNAMVASDPRLPFGGVKRSGHGRELGSAGIREFVNAKTIFVREEERPAVARTQ